MRFLLTGMTAQQANPASHERMSNWAGYLREALRAQGHSVAWCDPFFGMSLDTFDRVIVGVAPITSLGANRTYPALALIERLWDSDKLYLMVDAPEPRKIGASLKAIRDNPQNLLKPFFAYRKGYTEALRNEVEMRTGWKLLDKETWPTTIVPGLPWLTVQDFVSQLPAGAADALRTLNVDHLVLDKFANTPAPLTNSQWAYEHGSDPRWLKHVNVSWDVERIPRSSRAEVDSETIKLLHASSGCLINPDRYGTSWNTRYAMSLATGVPVFTDWQVTRSLGRAWAVLPQTYEEFNSATRRSLARHQLDAYREGIGSLSDVNERISSIFTATVRSST